MSVELPGLGLRVGTLGTASGMEVGRLKALGMGAGVAARTSWFGVFWGSG